MSRQGIDLQLTRYDERGWRATFYTTGMEHSPTISRRGHEALSFIEQGMPQVDSGRVQFFHSFTVMRLGEACLLVGRVDDAGRLATRALELSRGRRERGDEAWALWLLGEIAACLETPDAPDSRRSYKAAIALAAELGMRPLVAHCHLALGKLHRRTGKREQAQEHLTTATTMYREMGMQFCVPGLYPTCRLTTCRAGRLSAATTMSDNN